MTSPGDPTEIPEDIAEEAANWFAHLQSGDATEADHEAFNLWRAARPSHEEAVAELRRLWAGLETPLLTVAAIHSRRQIRYFSAALICLLSCALLIFEYSNHWRHSYVTDSGLRRTVIVEDGSRLTLAGDTAVDYKMDAHRRVVTLVRGEAFFDVRHDAQRPFMVQTRDGLIRDVGTAFDVRLDGDDNRVTVARGVVEVTSRGMRVRVYPNQQVRYGTGIGIPVDVDTGSALAWTRGRLLFESRALSFVVNELDRYTADRLVLLGTELGSRPVTGVVDLDHIDGWLDALAASQHIHVVRLYRLAVLY